MQKKETSVSKELLHIFLNGAGRWMITMIKYVIIIDFHFTKQEQKFSR